MTTIAPDTLARRLQDDSEPVVLDIRDPESFEDWHVPNSTNIPVYEELREDPDAAKDELRRLPDDEEVVTVCGAGIVSQTATDLLRDLGYEAKTLEEGLMGWSRVHLSAPVPIDVPGTLHQVARPGKGCLSYVLVSEDRAAVFDPSQFVAEYDAILADAGAELVAVFETHAHADHFSGAPALAEAHEVPHYLHPDDALDIDTTPIEDGDTVPVGEVGIEAIHTPGHSPGSVTFDVGGEALLTGDTLFHGSVGRVELGDTVGLDGADPGRNAKRLYESVRQLVDRDDDPFVLPAHDSGSPEPPVIATLAAVVDRNPELDLDKPAFVEELVSAATALPPNVRRIKLANVGLEEVDEADRTSLELGPNRCAAE